MSADLWFRLDVAVAIAVSVSGCGSSRPPDAPTDAGADRLIDAGAGTDPDGASEGAVDATGDTARVHGETCADPIDVNIEVVPDAGVHLITNSLAGYEDDYRTCSQFNTDGDVVYVYTAPTSGLLRAYLSSGSLKKWAIRSDCEDAATFLTEGYDCAFGDTDGCSIEPCGFRWPVEAGAATYFLVDGEGYTPKMFDLEIELQRYMAEGEACDAADWRKTCDPSLICRTAGETTPTCRELVCGDGHIERGDGHIERNEECDDENTNDGDGCSSSCRVESQGAGGETCETATVLHFIPIYGGSDFAAGAGDTSTAAADLSGTCATSTASPDLVYSFTLDAASAVAVEVVATSAAWDPVAYLLEASGDTCSATGTGCETVGAAPGRTWLSFDSLDSGTYYLVIDGDDTPTPGSGMYSFGISKAPI